MTARGSLQGVGCGSPKRGVVVGWGWGLMKENSQQVTPSLYLGVLSQRLDLPLPGWQRGALAHKSRGRPSGSRPATQRGLIVVMVIQEYTYVQTHQIAYINYM